MERWQQDSNLSSITPGVREVLSPAQRTLDSEGTRTLGSHMCSAADFHVLLQSLPQAMGGGLPGPWSQSPCGCQAGAPVSRAAQPPGTGCLPWRASRAGARDEKPEEGSWSRGLQQGHEGSTPSPCQATLGV